jgi:hypothetical protein
MASLISSCGKILSLKVKPEEGELHLLKFLDSHLDESFEFNFIQFINVDRPHIWSDFSNK